MLVLLFNTSMGNYGRYHTLGMYKIWENKPHPVVWECVIASTSTYWKYQPNLFQINVTMCCEQATIQFQTRVGTDFFGTNGTGRLTIDRIQRPTQNWVVTLGPVNLFFLTLIEPTKIIPPTNKISQKSIPKYSEKLRFPLCSFQTLKNVEMCNLENRRIG